MNDFAMKSAKSTLNEAKYVAIHLPGQSYIDWCQNFTLVTVLGTQMLTNQLQIMRILIS